MPRKQSFGDTEVVRYPAGFQTTVWDLVLQARDPDSPERRKHLGELLQLYWRPLYKHIRVAWGKSNEEAKDLTQEFICKLLEGEFLEHVDQQRGRFRDFLRACLTNFLRKDHQARKRIKRGGRVAIFPLDTHAVDRELQGVPSAQGDAERLFDQEWARSLLQEGIECLKRDFEKERKELYFRIFSERDLNQKACPDYRTLAKRHRISEGAVRYHLFAARRRLRQNIVDSLRNYVRSEDELQEELALLSDALP